MSTKVRNLEGIKNATTYLQFHADCNLLLETPCENAASDTSIQSVFNEEQDSDEDIADMVFVDGNEADLDECDDEDTLMERVSQVNQ